MVREITIPQLGLNEEFVRVVEWYVNDGDRVKAKTPICLIETSKATAELEAEEAGFVRIRRKSGEEARIKETIGYIVSSLDIEIKDEILPQPRTRREERLIFSEKNNIKVTKKAKQLAVSLGINPGLIGKKIGIIREKDIREFYELRKKEMSKVSISHPEFSARGEVNKDFLQRISQDKNFAQLSSDEKIAAYKKNGAIIGKNVILGQGVVIIANYIEIGDDTRIGDNCYIKAAELKIGRMAAFDHDVSIVARKVKIGDVLFTGNNIVIGAGGAFGPNSELEVGDNCLISSGCVINTAEKITIGNVVGLSPRVQIYTHNHWQNVLEGYHPNFAPVTIGDYSYITGNCLIVPGVNIGKGCTVLANSLVTENVEDYTIVAGVPAKKIKAVDRNLSPEKKDRIMKRLMVKLKELLKFKGFNPEDVIYTYRYHPRFYSKSVVLTFNIPGNVKQPKGVMFDLTNYKVAGRQDALSDEVRNFLRKRGIRFKPIYWRYTADEGFYNQ